MPKINVRIDDKVLASVRSYAKTHGTTVSFLVRSRLEELAAVYDSMLKVQDEARNQYDPNS